MVMPFMVLHASVFCLFLLRLAVGKCFLLVTSTKLKFPFSRMLQKISFELHMRYKVFFSVRPGLMCVHGLYLCRAWDSVSFCGGCSWHSRW
jgi:hypothetical protein